MLGTTFISDLAIKLRDAKHRQWSQVHATSALNSALRALTKVKPRVYTVNELLPLAAGHEQVFPSDCNELITLLYSASNGVVGDAVIMGDMAMMDHDHPSWRNDTAVSAPRYWFYEPESHEHTYYVWPPIIEDSESVLEVMATISKTPVMSEYTSDEIAASAELQTSEAGLVALDSEIPVLDYYVDAMFEWALYYSTSRDDEATSNYARSKDHFARFFELLGIQAQAEMATRKVRELIE